jgi:hypothetical protein
MPLVLLILAQALVVLLVQVLVVVGQRDQLLRRHLQIAPPHSHPERHRHTRRVYEDDKTHQMYAAAQCTGKNTKHAHKYRLQLYKHKRKIYDTHAQQNTMQHYTAQNSATQYGKCSMRSLSLFLSLTHTHIRTHTQDHIHNTHTHTEY